MATLVNRVKMSTSTTGTGTITLGSAEDGYQSFADAGVTNGDVVRYVIEDGYDWEIGSGTYNTSTLTRSVEESSSAGSAISLSGNAIVFITAAAQDIVQNLDDLNDLSDTATTDGETVVYNATDHTWVTRKVTTDDISDIDNTGKADGAVLVYENSSGKYKATIIVQGGTF